MANKNPVNRKFEKPWTDEDIEKLKNLYPHYPTDYVASKIGKTYNSIKAKAAYLKLIKYKHKWQVEWEDFLMKNWLIYSPQEIADELLKQFGTHKTRWAVINKRRELKAKKNHN